MRNYCIDTLKDGHQRYDSGMHFTWDTLKHSLDKLKKQGPNLTLLEMEGLKVVSQKKKEENREAAILQKYLDAYKEQELKGNLLYRYLNLDEQLNKLDFQFKEKRDEDIKEITRICKMMKINFGKKNPNDAFFGAFTRVFEAYISCPKREDEANMENLLNKLKAALPDFPDLTMNTEILGKMQPLFEYLFQKSAYIFTCKLRPDEGYVEFNCGFDINFADLADSGRQIYTLGEDNLDMAFEFDDLEMHSEYVNQTVSDGTTVLVRGDAKAEAAKKEVEYGQLGTEEEAAKVKEVEAQIAAMKQFDIKAEEGDTHQLEKEIKPDSPFKEFYNNFKSILCKNEYWQVNLFNCLDMLADLGKSSDLLFDQILNYFDGNIEPTMFMVVHRAEIIADFIKTKQFVDKMRSKKAGKRYLSNITQRTEMEEDIGKTNHEVLYMLGMTEKEIQMEERLGLKEKHLRLQKERDEQLEATYGRKEEDFMDFVNLRSDEVSLKAGSSYSKVELPTHIVYDCKPEPKAELKGELYPVEQFPEHIARVFGDIKCLNQLQTQVKEVAFDSDENMLVCAPTGAGKTNVALLTILREFNKTYDHVTKKTGDFKIVYISPLKALATEIVDKFQSKLGHAGVVVKEFTGDMSLTRQELLETHIIVSTPEKWDVMTRKSDTITELVKMIIIDEIHLLDEERGRVLECIVARTSITIERRQKNIRLVGLSATLPNYVEVAKFMQVKKGLFYFSEAYRPVPLYKKFIGVRQGKSIIKTQEPAKVTAGGKIIGPKTKSSQLPNQQELINQVLYDIVRDNLTRKEQILIFVHSRKDTVKTGMILLDMAMEAGDSHLFQKPTNPIKENVIVNKDLKALVSKGIGAHNAGLCRKDRRLIEDRFLDGTLRIVVCTATLAWGVNLPAHTVIIKGTDIYEPGVGFKDLSILDVQQIFGRAGRPQFDSYGEAILITKIERLNYFMGMMTTKISVKSQFEGVLLEALNAEIALGNITTLSEAYDYIKRTFYYVRAKNNPRSIGADTPMAAEERIHNLIEEKLTYLHTLKFIRYDRHNLLLESTELGRICSHYYVNCPTMEKFCMYLNFYEDATLLEPGKGVDAQGDIEDQDLLAILAQASEFNQIQVRQDEIEELHKTEKQSEFLEPVHPEFKRLLATMEKKMDEKAFDQFKDELMGDQGEREKRAMDSYKKVMTLIQGYLSMQAYDNYSLVADTHYIVQNGTRILRCLYDICLKKNIAYLAMTVLKMSRFIENNIRDDLSCMRMFCYENVKRGILSIRRGQDIKDSKHFLEDLTCRKIEQKMYGENSNYNLFGSVSNMREENDLGVMLKISHGEAYKLKRHLWSYPLLKVESSIRPIAQTILKVDLKVTPDFYYSKQFHLSKENFELLVVNDGEILHHEEFGIFTKNLMKDRRPEILDISFFVPFKERAEAYSVYIMSDRFVGADIELELNLKEVMIHTEKMEYTDLLDLRPLKVSTLNNPLFERLYKIKFFNPIQTQLFHALYHTDNNCIVGAPTGSGKTIMAELAMLRIFAQSPKKKIVYIGPYKALVKERLIDWKKRLESKEMGKKVLELTGDYTPDLQAIISSDVLVTTPEKWDGISRNWQSRNYVTTVGLIVFDEIHLLGQDRGPVIEVIVSRMNYISSKLGQKIRMVGLSTAMASSSDVASWFGVPKHYMFNFRPNVRPVPVEIHFKGFGEKNYCPRMNTMNKPAFNDIKKFSSHAPVLVSFLVT
jgi:activating signal cointegrator complex subunit 3